MPFELKVRARSTALILKKSIPLKEKLFCRAVLVIVGNIDGI